MPLLEDVVETVPLNEGIENIPNSLAESFKILSVEYLDRNKSSFTKYLVATIACIIFDMGAFVVIIMKTVWETNPVFNK